MGDQETCRDCLNGLLAESPGAAQNAVTGQSTTNGAIEATLGFVQRDLANYLLANSFYEQRYYVLATQVYQGMYQRLNALISASAEEYPGQAQYINQLQARLNLCAARQAIAARQSQAKP